MRVGARPGERPLDSLGRVSEEPDRTHWALVNEECVRIQASGLPVRANYTWSILHAADIAARTGVERISVLEFGVAGGNGLIAMEAAAAEAESVLGVGIDVHGLDTGAGLPAPQDHRDAPYIMEPGDFPMDAERLRTRLSRAQLHLGEIRDTLEPFVASEPAPIGFVAFDLDYYSSTRDALRLLHADPALLMPRVLCYFDDTLGYPWGESNGARLAIADFNTEREDRKLDLLEGMKYLIAPTERDEKWVEALYLAHLHDHPRYSEFEGTHLTRRLDLAGAD